MLYLSSPSTDPYFNLAAEEYFLKNSNEELFMLWRSKPSVIVGKHQNALAEINYRYVLENNIDIARRLTGGGTVVHDLQNLNFTFIANGEEGKLIDFKRFVMPIIKYLGELGIDAYIGETNDIRIGDYKISGNAEHVYKKRVLHHGTLLFNSNLDQLKQAIKVKANTYIDKAVQSNRSSVCNIISHLKAKISIEEFTQGLFEFIMKTPKDLPTTQFPQNSIDEINKLANTKYKTEEWIFCYSPKYLVKKTFLLSGKQWEIELQVEKGAIKSASILRDAKPHPLGNRLTNIKHLYPQVLAVVIRMAPELTVQEQKELAYNFF